MSNEPGAPGPPGEYQPGQQGWGAPQQPPHPGGFGQQQPQQPPPGWGGYPPPGQPGYGMPPPPVGGPQGQSKNPLSALFDFNFDTFVTPSVVKVLYIVGMVLAGLFYIAGLIGGFTQGVGVGLLALIGGAIVVLLWITMFRVLLEFYYAVVRMSEDIHRRG